MPLKVKFSKKFSKQYNKAPAKIRKSFDKRLRLFLQDKFDSQLNNHQLIGKLKGHRSINISGDWRAVFREFNAGDLIYFDLLGAHNQLYK